MMQKAVTISFHENVSKMWKVFMTGVHSVDPEKIVQNFVRREGEKLMIGNAKYHLNNNVYLVGFGKAVSGMVGPIENALKINSEISHLQKGIISIPSGMKQKLNILPSSNTTSNVIEYLEGATNNIPDEEAFRASKKIVSLVQSLKEQDLLLVLISGGGSALLPYPAHPLTLEEKSAIIKSLSRGGANINELNTVRKALSVTKGGGLALMTKANIVSLIISDVIGNSLDIIASSPTTINRDSPAAAIDVLLKYNVPITDRINQALQGKAKHKEAEFSHVNNNIIGSIEIALSAINALINNHEEITSCSLVLSSSLNGDAAKVGANVADFAGVIIQMIHQGDDSLLTETMLQDLCVDISKKHLIKNIIEKSRKQKCPIWFIFGGETTVTVTGTGQGGRNQEMVLSTSINLEKVMQGSSFKGEVIFMSGGTDGIDGPTDAAGALTYWTSNESQLLEARKQELDPESFLQNNASYDYFSQLSSGRYLFKPGHTGTNVMDIQILVINPAY